VKEERDSNEINGGEKPHWRAGQGWRRPRTAGSPRRWQRAGPRLAPKIPVGPRPTSRP
jgi:hypothetical protein